MLPQNFIFIGRSGCGKGTQAKLLKEHLSKIDPQRQVFYLQTGAEFRKFIQGGNYTQKLSRKILDRGGLTPEFLAVYMWSRALAENFKEDEHLIVDGSPRKFHEAGVLDSIFDFYKREKPYLVSIVASEGWAIERLRGRGRFDDNSDDIKARLSWYETDVLPAINFYRNNPRYVFLEINGEQTIEKVHRDILEKLSF
ncbi:MAG: nucleoside monophosphate kinase [Patescibacteria group bacterium]|nr:nucleoside monophosphate kinase [Patescibacteria group bacterium]MDE1988580.1 nucleoside monophosphate kinase [Patescibacteria group bacterium]MDE2218087.1 nucleoside monophosphate kinase [Patescibacteria group bacterium]